MDYVYTRTRTYGCKREANGIVEPRIYLILYSFFSESKRFSFHGAFHGPPRPLEPLAKAILSSKV